MTRDFADCFGEALALTEEAIGDDMSEHARTLERESAAQAARIRELEGALEDNRKKIAWQESMETTLKGRLESAEQRLEKAKAELLDAKGLLRRATGKLRRLGAEFAGPRFTDRYGEGPVMLQIADEIDALLARMALS